MLRDGAGTWLVVGAAGRRGVEDAGRVDRCPRSGVADDNAQAETSRPGVRRRPQPRADRPADVQTHPADVTAVHEPHATASCRPQLSMGPFCVTQPNPTHYK